MKNIYLHETSILPTEEEMLELSARLEGRARFHLLDGRPASAIETSVYMYIRGHVIGNRNSTFGSHTTQTNYWSSVVNDVEWVRQNYPRAIILVSKSEDARGRTRENYGAEIIERNVLLTNSLLCTTILEHLGKRRH